MMKNQNVLFLAVLLMFTWAANGGVLDDFEAPDYQLGSIKGQQGWDGDSFSSVIDFDAAVGVQALEIGRRGEPNIPAGQGSIRKEYDGVFTEGQIMSYYLKPPGFNTNGNNFEIFHEFRLPDTSFTKIFDLILVRNPAGVSERIQIQTVAGSGNYQPINPLTDSTYTYDADQWMKFEYILNFSQQSIQLRIDDQPITDYFNTNLGARTGDPNFPVFPVSEVNRILFNNNPGSFQDPETGEVLTSTAKIDNIASSLSVCADRPQSDIHKDCLVNILDFAVLAAEWLFCGFDPPSDCP